GEFEVALVVSRHRHDGAGAVLGQQEVGDPDRHFLAGKGIVRLAPGVEPFLLDLALETRLAIKRTKLGATSSKIAPARTFAPDVRPRTSPPSRAPARAARTWRHKSCRCAS